MRSYQEFAAPGTIPPETLDGLTESILSSKPIQALLKRQKDTGVWGGNLLALGPSAKDGIKEIGTIPQHRRLLQVGVPHSARAFKLAERVLFRILSRDDDPVLMFENHKLVKEGPEAVEWSRERYREAATAALAEAGYQEDPRIRGAAHKIASNVSQFLRSPLAEKPFARVSGKTVLDPEAHPPTWYSVAMIAGALARLFCGAIADHWLSSRRLLGILGVTMALSAFVVASINSNWPGFLLYVAALFYGATAVGWNGVYLAEVARIAPPGRAGAATGASLAVTYLGVVVLPLVFWAVHAASGGYAVSFVVAGSLTLWRGLLFLKRVTA